MTQFIDPEFLVAYVDGQLDQSETARVVRFRVQNTPEGGG